MKKTILFLLVLLLSSCAKDNTLNPPENILFDDTSFLLTWDEVKSADSYQISVNDMIYTTTSLSYDLSTLSSGDYTVKIKSITSSQESRFSIPITISIPEVLSLSITIDSEQISWLSIPQATLYTIIVRDINHTLIGNYTTTNLTFSTLDLYGVNHVEIIAVQNDLIIAEHAFLLDLNGYIFSTSQNSFNLSYDQVISTILIDNTTIPSNLYTQSSSSLIINGDYLKGLSLGDHIVTIQSEIPYYLILNIDDTEIPYILSESIVFYNDLDLIFEFELFDGSFSGITSSYDLLENDYSIIDGTLTINQTYFDRILNENPELNQIIFTYLLISGSYNQYGYITVKFN